MMLLDRSRYVNRQSLLEASRDSAKTASVVSAAPIGRSNPAVVDRIKYLSTEALD